MQRGMIMHQSDIERFAFLFLCGKRDRAILLGREKMTFSDFGQADVCYRFPWPDKIEPGYLRIIMEDNSGNIFEDWNSYR